jgi:hypothetical protein
MQKRELGKSGLEGSAVALGRFPLDEILAESRWNCAARWYTSRCIHAGERRAFQCCG